MKATLVLNADATPMSIVPLSVLIWQDAIKLIYLDKASVLEEYDRWVVRSPSVQMRMPSVVLLREYRDHDGDVEFSRHNIFLRDDFICQYCAKRFVFDDLTFDHVIPRRDGGKTIFDNILTACGGCNQEKGHEYRKPLRKPYTPGYWDLAKNCRKLPLTIPHQPWINYLNWEGEITVNENLRHINVEGEEFKLNDLLL